MYPCLGEEGGAQGEGCALSGERGEGEGFQEEVGDQEVGEVGDQEEVEEEEELLYRLRELVSPLNPPREV